MTRILTFITLILLFAGRASAVDKYDEFYDRPTYFNLDIDSIDSIHSLYANNMCIFAYAKTTDDTPICNFEIAVYDQKNRLRTTGRSISNQGNLCTLTISGQEGDKFHFEVLYGDFDHPTILPAIETFPFKTNANIGSGSTDFYFTVSSAPQLSYWNGDPSAQLPTATVSPDDIKEGILSSATRIDLKGIWDNTSAKGLFNGCKSLLYVQMETTPLDIEQAFSGANPNCLIYLPSSVEKAPEGLSNCISGGKALTDIILTDGDQDNPHPFLCPAAFSLNGKKAIYSRTDNWKYANGKSGWNTVLVPFDAAVKADGVTVTALDNLDLSDVYYDNVWMGGNGYWACPLKYVSEGSELMFKEPQSDGIKANTPYVFSLPGNSFVKTIGETDFSICMAGKTITFESTGSTIPATPARIAALDDASTDINFVGTYQVIKSKPMMILKTASDAGYDAFFYYEKANIMPFRAYLEKKPDVSAGKCRISICWEDDADGIVSLDGGLSGHGTAYDLCGRRVRTENRSRGIVIIGKKKVLR